MYEILKFKKLIEEYLLLQEKYSKIYNNKKKKLIISIIYLNIYIYIYI